MIFKVETRRGFLVEPVKIGSFSFPLSQTATRENATRYPSRLFAKKCAKFHGIKNFEIVEEND